MRKQILNVVVTLSVIATLSIAVFAALGGRLEASIPFDFKVNGKTLPAGKYIIEAGSSYSTTPNMLKISNWDAKQAICVITQRLDVAPSSKPRLVFHRYGNQYFLAQVIGDARGSQLPKSKAEREAARAGRDHLVMNAEPEIVIVNAQAGQ